jgi:hypothetical protein
MAKKQTGIIDAATQATWFSHVREAHHMEMAEDYVELIADLIAAKGEARLVDLSERVGVSHTPHSLSPTLWRPTTSTRAKPSEPSSAAPPAAASMSTLGL